MKTINGPHMYSEECGCKSCHDARARECRKTSSGCFNLDDIKTECKILLDAHKDWCKRGKGAPPSIMVNVHASELVNLCNLAENDGLSPEAAYWRKEYQGMFDRNQARGTTDAEHHGRTAAGWRELSHDRHRKIIALRAEVETLRAEVPLLKSPPIKRTSIKFAEAVMTTPKKGSYINSEVDGVVYSYRSDSMLIDVAVDCECGNTHCTHVDPMAEYITLRTRCGCGRNHTVWDQG